MSTTHRGPRRRPLRQAQGGRALHPRQGPVLRRHRAARDAPHGDPPQPLRARAHQLDRHVGGAALPGVVAVVTGELMAQHNLAWMPTLSGDTQAVLATDKVRYQGQEVACVIAESAVHREGRARADRGRLRAARRPSRARSSRSLAGRAADPRREGGADRQPRLPLGGGRQGRHRAGLRRGRPGRGARHLLPALPPGAARVLRLRRRRQPGDREGDDLPDLAGAARAPHAVRDRRRAAGAEHPDHHARTSAAASATRCRSTRATSSRRPPRS